MGVDRADRVERAETVDQVERETRGVCVFVSYPMPHAILIPIMASGPCQPLLPLDI